MGAQGLSKARLQRFHDGLERHVERRDVPGLVALVARDGDLHVETLGTMTLEGGAPMRRDAIFRIASITKPITAVAAMILVEECRLRLDDSIEPWLPELANRRVLRTLASEPDDTVPANRAITLRDMLTFRMGFGSVMVWPPIHPIQRLIREKRIGGDGPPAPTQAPTTLEWIANLSSLPWIAQPGERWLYHVSADALGILIGRVAGKTLGSFMRERIFEPLGMKDTAFNVPSAKIDRLPGCYAYDPSQGVLVAYDDPTSSAWEPEPPSESGGGGLVSTIDDYFAFSTMMLNKGRYNGKQIVSRATVELMTTPQVTAAQRAGHEMFFGEFGSWGLGMAVDIFRDEIYRTPGRFGWDGGTGTSAYTDPAERMIGILFTQRMMDSPQAPRHYTDFWTLAYAAMK